MKKVNTSRRGKGFTLVELVIVIAVIAVLSAVLIPVFSNVVTNAKAAALRANVKSVNTNLLLRALNEDNRTSYSADEINQILDEFKFDRSNTPSGYSLWYDKSINNIRLFKNEEAFSAKNPSVTGASVKTVYAADNSADIEIGSRPVEALNPFNRNLYYIDRTNKDVNNAIDTIKGANGKIGVIAAAEKNGGTVVATAQAIVNNFQSQLSIIATKLAIGNDDLKTAFDLNNTLFIGSNAMYINSFYASSDKDPSVTCNNAIVDSSVTEITSQKLQTSSDKTAANLEIKVSIVIPSKVQYIDGEAFSSLGANGGNRVSVEVDQGTMVNKSGVTGASVSFTDYSGIASDGSFRYEEANIVYGRDYTCEYPANGQYFYTDVNGKFYSGTLANGQKLENISDAAENGAKVRVKYLVPQFNILNNGKDCFFAKVSSIDKLYVNNNKIGNLIKYSAVVLLTEGDVQKGYKFSDVGYFTNLNAYVKENYDVTNHTGKTENFNTEDKATVTVKLPEGATSLKNYQGKLQVKVNYKTVINKYDLARLMDGTIYYTLSSSTVESAEKATEKLSPDSNGNFVFSIEKPSDMPTGYYTYSTAVQSIEVYFGDTLILVRYY